MINQVTLDLRVFLLFYCILLYMFALMLGILDLGNFEFSEDTLVREAAKLPTAPELEYKKIHKFIARFLTVA